MILIAALALMGLEPPITQFDIRVRQEVDGGCAELEAGRKGSRPVLHMAGICHGWSSFACQDLTFFKGQGVTEDQAQILFTRGNRTLDLVRVLEAAVVRKWPGRTHLHLFFGPPRCENSFAVGFTGSQVDARKGGSARGMKGRIWVGSPTAYRVWLSRDD